MRGKFNFPKRLFATVLSAVMAFTTVPVIGVETAQAAVNTLNGVSETHWARNSIEKMVNQNILSGDEEGNLHPDRPVTRAEYVAMINRAFGYNKVVAGGRLPFTDIQGTEWYADHIRIAYKQGYFGGIDANTAGATREITREEAAAMICRNLKIESTKPQVESFADGNEISQWSKPSVGAAVEKGFIHGYTDGSFRPKNLISRAEAATMFSNAMGTIYDKSGTYGQGMVEGNVTISRSNVTLNDMVITGDLYLTEGVGTGYVNLKNVTVLGEVIVCGGGEGNFGGNSVTLDNCTIWKLTVDGSDDRPVSLYAKGNTNIPETNIKSTTYLQNHPDTEVGFDNIEVKGPEETTLYLSGTFANVSVMESENKVVLGKGRIENLTVDEDAEDAEITLDRNVVVENMNLDGNGTVTGRGDIENLIVTTEDTSVETLPENIEIRPGITADIGGKEMTSLDATEASSAPKITAGYPRAEEITSAAAKVYFETNKPGTIRWALIYDDMEELDEDEILKPTTITRIQKYGSLNVAESEKEVMMSLSGLESNATYILYAVLVDERGDVSRIKEEEIETADKTQPGFVSGYPKTVPLTSNSFAIDAMLIKNGSIYWAVYKKGAAAPTAYQLRSQNLDGTICHGVKKNAEKNIQYNTTDMTAIHDDLNEKETYDVYVMTSDGEKDSKIVKLSAKTKDTTPPKYNPEPYAGQNDATSAGVVLGADEDVTAHYVVIPWNEVFPVPVPEDKENYPEPPALNSEYARRQVLNGNNAFKSGKSNVKANTDTTIKIGGLAKETPYHVFIVLEDAAGNFSEWVIKVDVKTRDVTAPKVEMAFENTIGGKADVEEDIMLAFNEIACYLAPGTLLKGTEGVSAKDHLKGLEKAGVFQLKDVSSTKEVVIPINYDPVMVDGKEVLPIEFEEGENGATIVVFHPQAFPQYDDDDKLIGYGLNSGASYRFILNHILDTTGNAMPKDYLVDIFQTAPPQVILEQTSELNNPKYADVDYAFTITPEVQQTSHRVLFDIIFTTDRSISFELLIWDPKAVDPNTGEKGDFVQIHGKSNETRLQAGGATTLHKMIDPLDPENKTNGRIFEKFSELEVREYAVRITGIDSMGIDKKDRWQAVVKMDVKCIAGEATQLEQIANDPIGNYAGAISGGKASLVNYSTQNLKDSTEFIMEMSFEDTVIPKFLDGYPMMRHAMTDKETEVGDIYIRPQLMTDHKAKLYYIIVPAGDIRNFKWVDDKEPVFKNPETGEVFEYNEFKEYNGFKEYTDIGAVGGVKPDQTSLNTALQFAIEPNDMQAEIWGSYEISAGGRRFQPQMPETGNLEPDTWYEMFCVLKGNPDTPSSVYYLPFKTKKTQPPTLTVTVWDKRAYETDLRIDVTDNKPSYIYWLIVPEYVAQKYISGGAINPGKEAELRTFIKDGAPPSGKQPYLDFGKNETTEISLNKHVLDITADLGEDQDLAQNNRFVLFAFGQLYLGNKPVGAESAIAFSEPFERKDTTAPIIFDPSGEKVLDTEIFPIKPGGDQCEEGDPYNGSVTIVFTEPLFYEKDNPGTGSGGTGNDGEGDDTVIVDPQGKIIEPLQYDPEEDELEEFLKIFFATPGVEDIITKVDVGTAQAEGAKVPTVKTCTFYFENVKGGKFLLLNQSLCDIDGNNVAGYYLQFEDMEMTYDSTKDTSILYARDRSYWTYGIITAT